MASFVYVYAATKMMSADLDLNGHDIRVALLSTNTTADTDEDAQTISGIGTLDEYDGANYARKQLASEAVAADTTNDRGEFDASDLAAGSTGWTSLGAGTRSVAGILGFRFITNDSDAVPIWWDDSAAQLPFNGTGADVGITWNSETILQLRTT